MVPSSPITHNTITQSRGRDRARHQPCATPALRKVLGDHPSPPHAASTPHPQLPRSQPHAVPVQRLYPTPRPASPPRSPRLPCRDVTLGDPAPQLPGTRCMPKLRPRHPLLSGRTHLCCSFQRGQCLLPTHTPLRCLNTQAPAPAAPSIFPAQPLYAGGEV